MTQLDQTVAAEFKFSPFTPEVRQDPYPYYKRLRENFPVYEVKPAGLWAVSRYDDVVYVLGHPQVFSSSIMAPADTTLLGTDPPEHTRVRKIISRAFSPPRIVALREKVQSVTYSMFRSITSRKEFDLVSDFSIPLPMVMITEMLGLESSRYADFKRWSAAVVVAGSGTPSPELHPELLRSIEEFNSFFQGVIYDRQLNPGDDFISTLLHSEASEEVLTPQQVLSICKLLLIAGNETTTNLIGNAVLALLRNPAQLVKVIAEPNLVPALVEETLRFDSPVQFLRRRATQDVEVSGTKIPAGSAVAAILGSANRDDRKFNAPDEFDIERNARDHIGFGHGIHSCLGASLARMEATTALEAFLTLLPQLRVAQVLDKIALIDSVQLRGPKYLRFTVIGR